MMGLRITQEEYESLLSRSRSRTTSTQPPSASIVMPAAKARLNIETYSSASALLGEGEIRCPSSPFLVTIRGVLRDIAKGQKQIAHERLEQAAAFLWLQMYKPELFEMATANPMGGYRPDGAGGQIKGEGAKAGYPDILIDYPTSQYHGLRIEMKRCSIDAKPSSEQEDWLAKLSKRGYLAVVCRGHEAAISVIKSYSSQEPLNEELIEKKAIIAY